MKNRYLCRTHDLKFKTFEEIMKHLKKDHLHWYAFFKDLDEIPYTVAIGGIKS